MLSTQPAIAKSFCNALSTGTFPAQVSKAMRSLETVFGRAFGWFRGHRQRAFWQIALGWAVWWILAFGPLAIHWNTNPQYTYGWIVLPLALVLLWRRWQIRPDPDPPSAWAMPLITASAFVVLPGWLILQPNLGWRLISWLMVLSAVAGTIGLSARLGGKSWARHFAFPVLFTLTAVPWPTVPEEAVVQGLMRFVAGVTVTLMNLSGLPAVQRGNLVEIATGVLGVDEACSGVRSLQATLMAALFLGEFYRLTAWRRLVLVSAGFAIALLTNVARTTFLSCSAARRGIGAVAEWHDPAGYTVLTVCLVIIALLGNWLSSGNELPAAVDRIPPANAWSGRAGALLGGWFLFTVAFTEAWYFRQPATAAAATWGLVPPPAAENAPLPAATLELLGCDRSLSATWQTESGAQWTMFFLEWYPNSQRASLLARVHRPEVCLPSSGLVESGPRRLLKISIAGFDLAFESMQIQ